MKTFAELLHAAELAICDFEIAEMQGRLMTGAGDMAGELQALQDWSAERRHLQSMTVAEMEAAAELVQERSARRGLVEA